MASKGTNWPWGPRRRDPRNSFDYFHSAVYSAFFTQQTPTSARPGSPYVNCQSCTPSITLLSELIRLVFHPGINTRLSPQMAVRSDQQASAEIQTGNGHENVGMRLPHTPGQQHLESVPIAATSRAPASSSSIKIAAWYVYCQSPCSLLILFHCLSLACRAIKGKCETPDGVGPCVRCARRRQQCERPIIHRSGRPKGSKKSVLRLPRMCCVW